MIRVLVAGLGNMGRSHALAYHKQPEFEIVGLVNRTPPDLPDELTGYGCLVEFLTGLVAASPGLVGFAG
ncbi:MAG: gfo/Idh/MocA family oxidoreductase, partial [Rhodobiaceae bacterium]